MFATLGPSPFSELCVRSAAQPFLILATGFATLGLGFKMAGAFVKGLGPPANARTAVGKGPVIIELH